MTSARTTYFIGSRKSQLALIQTEEVKCLLERVYPHLQFSIKTRDTKGDKVLEIALSKIGDKGLFTEELEQGMKNGEIDFAVHSLKDLPTELPDGLILGAVTTREDPNDVVIFRKDLNYKSLKELPSGSIVGSSSLRRVAQLRRLYPHLVFRDIRGNLNTRFRKLDDPSNGFSAIILAYAGLHRLGDEFSSRISQRLDDIFYAPGQGALAVECRADDSHLHSLLSVINDKNTWTCCSAERAFLRTLKGGCHVPVGVRSQLDATSGVLTLSGIILSLDGTHCIQRTRHGPPQDAEQLGVCLAQDILQNGGDIILKQILQQTKTKTM
jgi:hydroxymethylbilane synthase